MISLKDYEILLYGGSGTDNGSYRYRILNLKEQLDFAGINSKIILDLHSIPKLPLQNRIIVLHRTAWDSDLFSLKNFAEKHSIPLVYDVDDYVFDPKINKFVRGIEELNENQKIEYFDGVRRYRKALLSCDAAITTTSFLKERIEEEGIPAHVHKNAISNRVLNLSEKARKQRKRGNFITIGYFSGTNTHNYDFRECSDALLQIMKEFENVNLLFVGPLEIDSSFNQFSSRILRSGLVDWTKLPRLVSTVDINLSPLEMNNPFCIAKSELKYFDGGIVNVPTIASATQTFKEAITNGKNGFLASSQKEWKEFLYKLITDEKLRERIAKNALNDARENYTSQKRATQLDGLFNKIREHEPSSEAKFTEKKSAELKKHLSVSWVVGTPEAGQGGFRTITRNCQFLSKFGHDVTLYVDPGSKFKNQGEIEKFLKEHYGTLNYKVRFGHDFEECDVLVATFWTTAYNVYNSNKAKTKIYFVQDFEPFFYEVGEEYLQAENSYSLGLFHITSFPWLPNLLKNRFNAKAEYFLPPIDRSIYKRKNHAVKKKKLQIAYYARPDQPRRCYDLGIRALNLVCDKIKNLDVVIFGSNLIDSSKIPFPHKNLGSLPKLTDLAEIHQNSDLGVVFSTTNPSLLPFEMMTCGCPIVDLDLEANRFNYGSRENVALAKPTPTAIANTIIDLINDEKKRTAIAENGYNFSLKYPDIEGMAKQVERLIINAHNFENKHSSSMESEEIDFVNVKKDKNLGEILPNVKIRQKFIPASDGLCAIELYFATYTKNINCDVLIKIEDGKGNEFAHSKIKAKKLKDNAWHKIKFFPIYGNKNFPYSLVISSPNSSPGNAITLYASEKKIENFPLYINDKEQKSILCMRTFSKSSYFISEEKADFINDDQSELINKDQSPDTLIDLLDKKTKIRKQQTEINQNRLNNLEKSIYEIMEKLEDMNDSIDNFSDSLMLTRTKLEKLDSKIYRATEIWPLKFAKKLFGGKLKDV